MRFLVLFFPKIWFKCSTILVLVILIVSCNSQKSGQNFRLHYNAIYNVDAVLDQAEWGLVKDSYAVDNTSFFGEPNPQYFPVLTSAIERLQDLLPRTNDSKLKSALYFRLGKAYFLKSDYYNALAYFDVMEHATNNIDLSIWKGRTLNGLQKTQENYQLLQKKSPESLSKLQLSELYATKADMFRVDGVMDSATHYLHLAVAHKASKRYTYSWQLRLGKLYAIQNRQEAIPLLSKVARANRATDLQKMEASLSLVQLQNSSLENRISAYSKILEKGYSIGKEWVVYAAISQDYLSQLQIDSAEKYAKKVFVNELAEMEIKNRLRWDLGQFFVQHHNFEKASGYFVEIDKDFLSILDSPSKILITHYENWLELLEKFSVLKQTTDNTESYLAAAYNLVDFYKHIGLKDEAVSVLKGLSLKSQADHQDYAFELNLLDSNRNYLTDESLFNEYYEKLYVEFEKGNYEEVIAKATQFIQNVNLSREEESKIAYLKAFAIGYSQPVDALRIAFRSILDDYANTEVFSLVISHLSFIENNSADFDHRKYALEKPKGNYKIHAPSVESSLAATANQEISLKNIGTFIDYTLPKFEPYYYVIMIENTQANVAPIRYSLGQYLRTRYPNSIYKHTLIHLENKAQLISVGEFESLKAVSDFEGKILDFLPEIIKLREKKYTTFVIPKLEMDKSKDLFHIYDYLDKYINK